MRGAPTTHPHEYLPLDVCSPHAFIDVFRHTCGEHNFYLGEQADAREALGEILRRTHLGLNLFDTKAEQAARSDLVSLPAFVEGEWWYKKYVSVNQVIDMLPLLTNAFTHLDYKLRRAPPLLALVVPQFAQDESDTDFWLGQLLWAHWGDAILSLVSHLHEDAEDRDKAKYSDFSRISLSCFFQRRRLLDYHPFPFPTFHHGTHPDPTGR